MHALSDGAPFQDADADADGGRTRDRALALASFDKAGRSAEVIRRFENDSLVDPAPAPAPYDVGVRKQWNECLRHEGEAFFVPRGLDEVYCARQRRTTMVS